MEKINLIKLLIIAIVAGTTTLNAQTALNTIDINNYRSFNPELFQKSVATTGKQSSYKLLQILCNSLHNVGFKSASDSVDIVDSIYFEAFSNATRSYFQKSFNTYDSTGKIVTEIEFIYNNKTSYSKTDFTYNSSGLLSFETTYDWKGLWDKRDCNYYRYDSIGRLIENSTIFYKAFYYYDSNGNLVSKIEKFSEFALTQKVENTFNNNQLTGFQYFFLRDGHWESSSKFIVTYQANGGVTQNGYNYNPITGNWTESIKIEKEYDGKGNIKTKTVYNLSPTNQNWELSSKLTYFNRTVALSDIPDPQPYPIPQGATETSNPQGDLELDKKNIPGSCTDGKLTTSGAKYILNGTGTGITGLQDNFDFAYVKVSGNKQLIARLNSLNVLTSGAQAGVMIRENLTSGSRHAMTVYLPIPKISHQKRDVEDGNSEGYGLMETFNLPVWLKIARKSNYLLSYCSHDGKNWKLVGLTNLPMPEEVYYGLAVVSGSDCNTTSAEFDSVSISDFNDPITSAVLDREIVSENIYSTYVQDSFKIITSFPDGYTAETASKYPIVYYLDGHRAYYHMRIRNLMQQDLIPKVITVGITYPKGDVKTYRVRDYTNTWDGNVPFYLFLKNELLPYLDNKYRVDTLNRTLFGHSYGAQFGFYALCQYTNSKDIPFRNLLLASPDQVDYLYTAEENLYKANQKLPVNVYVSAGSSDYDTDINNMKNIYSALKNRNYEGLIVYSVLNDGCTHDGNSDQSIVDGVVWAFNPHGSTSIQYNQFSAVPLKVWPNPSSGLFELQISKEETRFGIQPATIEVFDMKGQLVYRKKDCAEKTVINLSGFPRNIYVVKVKTDKKILTQRLVLQ